MPNNPYFVFDENKLKAEGMTKEQIYEAIAEATGATPRSIDDAFISKILEINKNKTLQLWRGTAAEFAALQQLDINTLYIITDDTTIQDFQAEVEEVKQAAEQIGEVEIEVQNLQTDVNGLSTRVTQAEEHVDQAVEDVDEAVGKVDAMESDVTQLQTDVDNAETNITALQGTASTLRNDLDDLGADVTQAEADIQFFSDKVTDIENKNGAVLLNGIVQPERGGGAFLGDYPLSKFNVVIVQFVDSLYYNKEVLCNVYHNGTNSKIVGTYLDVDPDSGGDAFMTIYLNCDEINNELLINYSKKVTLAGVKTGLPIAKITGVC